MNKRNFAMRNEVKLTAMVLAVIVLILIFSAGYHVYAEQTDGGTASFAGGTGTAEEPYIIETKQQLNAVRNNLSASYKLNADITFTDEDFETTGEFYNRGLFWEPIGSEKEAFTGSFDGASHKINNLRSSNGSCAGLFGRNEGKILKVYMENANISGSGYVGGIAGHNVGGTIQYCSFAGTLSGGGSYTGSIAGYHGNKTVSEGSYIMGTITSCKNRGTITVIASKSANEVAVGGITGYSEGGIYDCYNLGNISGSCDNQYANTAVGGVAGESKSYIERCYNTGTITSSKLAGGIAGYNIYYLQNCYNTGNVIFSAGKINYSDGGGGITGENDGNVSRCYNVGIVERGGVSKIPGEGIGASGSNGTVQNCYFLKGSASVSSTGGKECSYSDMMDKKTFSGFGMDGISTDRTWQIDSTGDYKFPTLRSTANYAVMPENISDFGGGFGTEDSPYIITTKEHLNNIRNAMSSVYRIDADIVFNEEDFAENGIFYNGGKGWLPIGKGKTSSQSAQAFTGKLDGNGHVIKGLYINRPNENDVGLFGFLGGTIMNLGIVDGNIIGDRRVGSIVGMVDTYTPKYERLIQNCFNTCSVSATYGYVAGIAGEGRGTIKNCYNTGIIKTTAANAAGGIVPIMQSGTISGCYNAGDISSAGMVGGIAGDCGSNAGIDNCYNIGTIIGNGESFAYTGGIAGRSSKKIQSCYNIGIVFSKGSQVGAITGSGTASTSYYRDTMACGWSYSPDENAMVTLDDMKQKETFSGFDFDSIWTISPQTEYPYPTLRGVPNATIQTQTGLKAEKTPSIPAILDYTTKTVTIQTVPNLFYSCTKSSVQPEQNSVSWKKAMETTLVFDDLENNTEYYLYAYNPQSNEEYIFCTSGALKFRTKMLGDVTGDRKIDVVDVLYLKRAIAGWDGYELNFSAGDVNGDGKVDGADIMALERHVAGWTGYETLP